MGPRRWKSVGALGAVGLSAVGLVAPTAPTQARPPGCDAQWIFSHVHNRGVRLRVLDVERDENHGRHTDHAHFSAERGGSVSWTLSGGIEGGGGGNFFGIIKAEVKAHIDASVTKTRTAGIGNTYDATLPPHTAATGRYGVFRRVATGHLYYLTPSCRRTHDHGYVTVQLPRGVGWRVTYSHLRH